MTTATAATSRLVRRNYGRGHGYQLDGQKIVGVTTALGVLDKPALKQWFANEAAKRVIDRWDELQEMQPSERFEFVKRGPRDTVTAAALRGTQIHDLGWKLVTSEDSEIDVPEEHRGPVEAYARWLDRWEIEPIAAETPLCSTKHGYGGTADLWGKVGKRDNALALLDIKTGKGVYDETGMQLAAYRYADLMQPEKGVEIEVPEVELVYVAHVLPDDVRMLPVVADEQVFRSFLYVLQAYRDRQALEQWPLIGSAVYPDGDDS